MIDARKLVAHCSREAALCGYDHKDAASALDDAVECMMLLQDESEGLQGLLSEAFFLLSSDTETAPMAAGEWVHRREMLRLAIRQAIGESP